MRFLVLTLAAFLCLASSGHAEEIRLGSKTLSIPPPDGYCTFDRNNPADAFVMDTTERAQAGQNQVLVHFAPCRDLDDWHAGRIPNYSVYGNVAVQLERGAPHSIALARREFLARTKSEMPEVDIKEVESEANATTDAIQISESQFLGILDHDQNALYVGILSVAEVAGQKHRVISITGLTLLGSIVTNINLSAAADSGTIDRLVAIQKAYVAELVRLNP